MQKKVRNIIVIVGLTSLSLLVLALFIFIFEQLDFIVILTGPILWDLSPLDTWLIVILLIFGPGIFISYFLLHRLRVLDLE